MQAGKPDFVHPSSMVRVEYSAETRADSALAWRVFSDWRRWRRFSDFYGDIRWLTGEPWAVRSRLRIELVRPVNTTVDPSSRYAHPANAWPGLITFWATPWSSG